VVLLLLVLGAGLPMQGQSRWQSFKTLTGPERCWVVGHLWVAGKAQRVSNHALVLADSVGKMPYMDGNWNGGLVDAFRHGIWMTLLTREIGPKKAARLGRAHEKGNYRMWKKGKLEDGALADAAASEMDLWNNQRGIEIAGENPKAAENLLIISVVHALWAGRMRIISQDSAGNFLDKNGDIIPEEKWKGLWENPRCLVKSKTILAPQGQ
jgi:hypothetical protein